MTHEHLSTGAPNNSALSNKTLFNKDDLATLRRLERSLLDAFPTIDSISRRETACTFDDVSEIDWSGVGDAVQRIRIAIRAMVTDLRIAAAFVSSARVSMPHHLGTLKHYLDPNTLAAVRATKSQSASTPKMKTSNSSPSGTAPNKSVSPRQSSRPRSENRPSKSPFENSPAVTAKTTAGESFLPATPGESEGGN